MADIKRYTVLVMTPYYYQARDEWAFTAADAAEQQRVKLASEYPSGKWQICEVRPNSIQGEP